MSSTKPNSAASEGLYDPSPRLDGFGGAHVWGEFTPLAIQKKAVNLGQGFPDWPAEPFVKKALADAVMHDENQYTRSAGHPALVKALANRYSRVLGRTIDANTEVTVNVGATEAIYALMQGLVGDGDEVLLLEPAFDIYAKYAQLAGGKVVFCPLHVHHKSKGRKEAVRRGLRLPSAGETKHVGAPPSKKARVGTEAAAPVSTSAPSNGSSAAASSSSSSAASSSSSSAATGGAAVGSAPASGSDTSSTGCEWEWKLDPLELENKLSARTRVLVLNAPHNPTGKVFSEEELRAVATVLAKYPRVVVISDEVYEHLVYDGREHTHPAALPELWPRTVTVSSSGKTFSITGWKIGWCVGPAALIKHVMQLNAWVQFSVPTPTQAAVATILEQADKPYKGAPSYYAWIRSEYLRKRGILVEGLRAAGLDPIVPEGGFFVMTATDSLDVPPAWLKESTEACPVMTRDWALARHLLLEGGVACIPPSAFHERATKPAARNLIRFAFCKSDDSLHEACRRLKAACSALRRMAGASGGAGEEEPAVGDGEGAASAAMET